MDSWAVNGKGHESRTSNLFLLLQLAARQKLEAPQPLSTGRGPTVCDSVQSTVVSVQLHFAVQFCSPAHTCCNYLAQRQTRRLSTPLSLHFHSHWLPCNFQLHGAIPYSILHSNLQFPSPCQPQTNLCQRKYLNSVRDCRTHTLEKYISIIGGLKNFSYIKLFYKSIFMNPRQYKINVL